MVYYSCALNSVPNYIIMGSEATISILNEKVGAVYWDV